MSEIKHPPGMYWSVHHDLLVEWCHSYEERAEYIRTSKPEYERAERLKWFQPVRGTLPDEVVQAAMAYDIAWNKHDIAWNKHDLAWNKHDLAWNAYDIAWAEYYQAKTASGPRATEYSQACDAFNQACDAFHQARDAFRQACDAFYQARDAYELVLKTHEAAIAGLHRQEQPDSPWNGAELVLQIPESARLDGEK
jgi:hypothetical protein